MKKLNPQLKSFLLIKSIKQLKKKSRKTTQFRQHRITSNTILQNVAYQNRYEERKKRNSRLKDISLKPKPEFAVLSDATNVIDFVFTLKKYAKRAFTKHRIVIDLSDISRIDIGAICLLLSVIEELSSFSIRVTGTVPTDQKCHEIFKNSGFLAHMKTITGNPFLPSTTKNLIIKRGKDKTQNQVVGETIKLAIEMITGLPSHYQPIFSIVQEINGNSVEHAYDENTREHWLFAINHDPEKNRVIFTFADNGNGILGTLKRKLPQQFFDTLQLKTDEDILRGAFTKQYNSRHKEQINRNKGLPLLKRIQDNQEIENMFVITNNVFLHINNYECVPITKTFRGTFYYWELDIECIERWKLRTTR